MKNFKPRPDLGGRCALREPVHDDANADTFPGAFEIADVGKARFVLPNEYDDERGPNAHFAQGIRARDEFGAQVGGKASSVENQGRHAVGDSFAEG